MPSGVVGWVGPLIKKTHRVSDQGRDRISEAGLSQRKRQRGDVLQAAKHKENRASLVVNNMKVLTSTEKA